MMHHVAKDITGRTFGRLTAIRPTPARHNGYIVWLCQCACGRNVHLPTTTLSNGYARDCGCKRAQRHTTEYKIWQGMLKRCRPSGPRRYAGRGITVCERWRSFDSFYADMGPRPSPNYSIDRINNDGHYEPGNCRWATEKQQKRNFSKNKILIHDGLSLPLIEWCERTGLSEKTLRHRVERGWNIQRALTTPQQQRRQHVTSR